LINVKRVAWGVRKAEEAMGSTDSGLSAADRAALVAAVERILAARGYAIKPAPAPAAVAAAMPAGAQPAAAAPEITAADVTAAVGRYLARTGTAPACACSHDPAAPPQAAGGGTAQPEPPPAPPAPPVEIVDFVCEADVREAIAKKKKIFIGKKTIVTPAARDAASGDEILVMAER